MNKTGYFAGGVQVIGKPGQASFTAAMASAGTCTDLKVNSPKASSTINNATGQYPLVTPNPWNTTYTNPEYGPGGVNTTGQPPNFYVSTVNGWNFHNTYFVKLKAAKLNSLGFNRSNSTFSQFDERATKCAGKWCVIPNDEQLHNSPAKACPVPAMTATNKTTNNKAVSVTMNNDSAVSQVLSALALDVAASDERQPRLGRDGRH